MTDGAQILIFTGHHRIMGSWATAGTLQDLEAFLNESKATIWVSQAAVQDLDGSRPSLVGSLAVNKADIVAVGLPEESGGQSTGLAGVRGSPAGQTIVLNAPPYLCQAEVGWRTNSELARLTNQNELLSSRRLETHQFLELSKCWLFLSLTLLLGPTSVLLNTSRIGESHILAGDTGSGSGLADLFAGMR